MLFYIADDDVAIRSMLAEIIEDEDLGEVVGEAEDGSMLDGHLLTMKKIDIVLIDLLMPTRDGIETIRHIGTSFTGKFIMISQVETKELVAEAYALGIEYYIQKPINRFEVLTVIKKVIERIRLERSILDIHKSLSHLLELDSLSEKQHSLNEPKIITSGRLLLSELGVIGENGCQDLLDVLAYVFQHEHGGTFQHGLPPLKDIFAYLAQKKLGLSTTEAELSREIKASQQRVRRTLYQSLNHLASLGLTDFSNPTFESYAAKFFDFTVVRERMTALKQGTTSPTAHTRINTKKFIQVLYYEAKRLMAE